MTTWQTVLLGAVAGLTIFLGLPMGRVRSRAAPTKTFLNGFSAGILIFLLFDILQNATGPLEHAVRTDTWARLAGLDDGIVTRLAKALHLAEATPSAQLAETTARNTVAAATPSMLHPGVLAYYRQAGLAR